MAIDSIAWKVRLFGTVRAESSSISIDRFQTQKTAVLFAMISLRPGQPQLREKLVDALWPEAEIEAGRNRLNQALAWLRRHLEPNPRDRGTVLIANRSTVTLNPMRLASDVQAFTNELTLAAKNQDEEAKIAALKNAVDLYTGDLLPEFYDQWVIDERGRLADARTQALIQLSELYCGRKEFSDAISFARKAVDTDPLNEESHEQLIRCLMASGQESAALRQYLSLEETLRRELSVSPSSGITHLVDELRRETPHAIRSDYLLPRPIPKPITRFFGRSNDIEQACELIEGGVRLISIVGIGGSGKTRLALETAGRLTKPLDGRVVYAPLADISDASQAPQAILDALRLQRSQQVSVLTQIVDFLDGSPYLLILDNAEHLLPGLTDVILDLLSRLPTLTVLLTSRQRLDVEGEHELHISPLEIPAEANLLEKAILSESVQLFVDRVRLVRPSFQLDDQNIELVAAICRRLEGLPLAIELCAAWAHTLTPGQMLERLLRRFDLLVSNRTDTAPRHRSIRETIEYSIALLDRDTQQFFTQLSVFRGGWTLEAIEAVRSAIAPDSSMNILEALAELRGRSLIETDDLGHEIRYRMLESLREFGRSQLNATEWFSLQCAHAEYFAEWAGEANRSFQGSSQQVWAKRLDLEGQNVATAIQWCLEAGRPEIGLRIASLLTGYWKMKGRLQDAAQWLSSLLTAAREQVSLPDAVFDRRILADGLTAYGFVEWSMGNFGQAANPHLTALAIREEQGDNEGISESLYHLGITSYRQDLFDVAGQYLTRSLEISEAHGNQKGVARALLNLGNLALTDQRPLDARGYYERSLVIEQELGDVRRVADSFSNIGLTYGAVDDYHGADRYFHQALAIRRELDDDYGLATDLLCLGRTAFHLDNKSSFYTYTSEGLPTAFRTQNKYIVAQFLIMVSMNFVSEAKYLKGLYFLCAYSKTRLDMGVTVESPTAIEYQDINQKLLRIAGRETYDIFHNYVSSLSMRRLSDECMILLRSAGNVESILPFVHATEPEDSQEIELPERRCPHCKTNSLVRYGRSSSGKQRFRCNECRKVVNEDYDARLPADLRRQAIMKAFHDRPLSVREAARTFGVSRNTLISWIKQENSHPG